MKLRKHAFLAAAAVLGTSLVSSAANAADANGLADQTQLILTADRLVPVFAYSSVSTTQTEGPNTTTETTNGSSTSLLLGEPLSVATIHTVPRVGFDFAIGASHFTVGGALVFGFGLSGS